MYDGRVACCPQASHVEYAPRALLMLEKRRDRQTDGRTPDRYSTLNDSRSQRKNGAGLVVAFTLQEAKEKEEEDFAWTTRFIV